MRRRAPRARQARRASPASRPSTPGEGGNTRLRQPAPGAQPAGGARRSGRRASSGSRPRTVEHAGGRLLPRRRCSALAAFAWGLRRALARREAALPAALGRRRARLPRAPSPPAPRTPGEGARDRRADRDADRAARTAARPTRSRARRPTPRPRLVAADACLRPLAAVRRRLRWRSPSSSPPRSRPCCRCARPPSGPTDTRRRAASACGRSSTARTSSSSAATSSSPGSCSAPRSTRRSSTTTTPRRSRRSTGPPRSTPSSTGTTSRPRSSTRLAAGIDFDWVLTTSAELQSEAPPSSSSRRETEDFVLWQRDRADAGRARRRTLIEPLDPGADRRLLGPGRRRLARLERHRVGAAAGAGDRQGWEPDARVTDAAAATQELELPPGTLGDLAPVREHPGAPHRARRASTRTLPANLLFRGPSPYYPVGEIEVDGAPTARTGTGRRSSTVTVGASAEDRAPARHRGPRLPRPIAATPVPASGRREPRSRSAAGLRPLPRLVRARSRHAPSALAGVEAPTVRPPENDE